MAYKWQFIIQESLFESHRHVSHQPIDGIARYDVVLVLVSSIPLVQFAETSRFPMDFTDRFLRVDQ